MRTSPGRSRRVALLVVGMTVPTQLAMIGRINRSTRSYLEKRGLPMPQVDFDVIKQLWVRAKQLKDA